MRLRQVALVAAELEPARQGLFELLGLDADYQDPGVGEFGLHNTVLPLGDTFLEVVAPVRPGTTAGRLLERRGGDGGYMVLFQVDNLAPYHERMTQCQARKVWEFDSPETRAFHIHPRDIGAAIVSIDEMNPPASWRWAGPGWEQRTARHVANIVAVDVQAGDPETVGRRWAELLDQALVQDGQGYGIQMEGSRVNFVPDCDGRGDGVSGVSCEVRDIDALKAAANKLGLEWLDGTVSFGGVQFRFV